MAGINMAAGGEKKRGYGEWSEPPKDPNEVQGMFMLYYPNEEQGMFMLPHSL